MRGEKTILLPLSRFDTHPRWPPVTQSLRSRRSYGKIGDCDQSNSISQKKQRYIYLLHFLQLTSACPSISCVSYFTCAYVRSHGIVTDRIGVTAVRVGGALVDICMRKWNRTRLKSHGDYICLIVYIWSLVYVFIFFFCATTYWRQCQTLVLRCIGIVPFFTRTKYF